MKKKKHKCQKIQQNEPGDNDDDDNSNDNHNDEDSIRLNSGVGGSVDDNTSNLGVNDN